LPERYCISVAAMIAIFTGALFQFKNICRNGAPPPALRRRSGTTTPLIAASTLRC